MNTIEQGWKRWMRRRLIQKAVAALGVGLVATSVAWADPPAQQVSEPVIEQYYGNRRIDVPRKVVEVPAEPIAPAKAETPAPVAPPPAPVVPPTPAALPMDVQVMPTNLPLTTPTVQMPGVIVFGSLRVANESGVQQATFIPETSPNSTVHDIAPKTPQTAPSAPAESTAKQTPAEAPQQRDESSPGSDNGSQVRSQSTDIWMIVGAVFFATLLTPVILFVLAFGVMRRWMGGNPLIRIEYVGKHGPHMPGYVLGPVHAGSVLAAGGSMAGAPATPVAPEPTTGERFDLGPTFEEELRQRQLNAQHQEDALLQKLFEDNVRLREQTAALAAETAPTAAATATETTATA